MLAQVLVLEKKTICFVNAVDNFLHNGEYFCCLFFLKVRGLCLLNVEWLKGIVLHFLLLFLREDYLIFWIVK
jgi:hypothetical protein